MRPDPELLRAGARLVPPPRAQGEALIRVERGEGRDRLARFRHGGSLKALWPRAAGRREAVLLNTAGGLTGGDRFDIQAEAGPGAALTLTTQAAERVYRAAGATPARVSARLSLEAGARIDWLPQETILFERAALDRRLEVEMAEDATLLGVEPLVLGREAMGESVERAAFVDRWRVRRGGRPIWADALRLVGDVAAQAARPGGFGANRAAATLLYVAPDAEDRLEAVRGALPDRDAGASAWNGKLVLRLLAPDGRGLRATLLPVLATLRAAPLPRVWTF